MLSAGWSIGYFGIAAVAMVIKIPAFKHPQNHVLGSYRNSKKSRRWLTGGVGFKAKLKQVIGDGVAGPDVFMRLVEQVMLNQSFAFLNRSLGLGGPPVVAACRQRGLQKHT